MSKRLGTKLWPANFDSQILAWLRTVAVVVCLVLNVMRDRLIAYYLCTENLLRGSVATDQDSRLSWNDRSWTGETTRSSVKFVGEEVEETHNSEDDEDVSLAAGVCTDPKKTLNLKMIFKSTLKPVIITHFLNGILNIVSIPIALMEVNIYFFIYYG